MTVLRIVANIASDEISAVRDFYAKLFDLDVVMDHGWIVTLSDRLTHEIEQERLTSIDRRLLRDMDGDRAVAAAARDPFFQSLRAGRLQKLGRLGLSARRSRHRRA